MRINLVPPQDRGRSQSRVDWLRMAFIVGAGLMVLLALSIGFTNRLIGIKKDELHAMDQSWFQLESTRAELGRIRRTNTDLQTELDRLLVLAPAGRSDVLLRALQDVATLVPAEAWIQNYVFAGDRGITLEGIAAAAVDITSLLQQLNELPYVVDVDLVSLRRMGEDDQALRSFTIQIGLRGAG